MGSDVFFYHGYTDVWLDGRWVKATPAFNRELTERFGLKPLDWDAVGDSIYHPFDLSGRRHMEYLAYRGVFADIPFDEIRGAFRHYYPRMTRAQEEMPLGGDFGAEGASEATIEVTSDAAVGRLHRPAGGAGQLRPAHHEHLHAGHAVGRPRPRRRRPTA